MSATSKRMEFSSGASSSSTIKEWKIKDAMHSNYVTDDVLQLQVHELLFIVVETQIEF